MGPLTGTMASGMPIRRDSEPAYGKRRAEGLRLRNQAKRA